MAKTAKIELLRIHKYYLEQKMRIRKQKSNKHGWLQSQFLKIVKEKPDGVALRECIHKPHHLFTYEELLTEALKLASSLKAQPGERVLLLMPGTSKFIIGFLACLLRGAVAVPVNLPGASKVAKFANTIRYIIEDCSPCTIIACRETQCELNRLDLLKNRYLLMVDSLPDHSKSLEDIMMLPQGPIFLQYSSGTTGHPKAVCNYDINMHAQLQILSDIHRPCRPVINTGTWLPFFHDMGIFHGLLLPVLSGGTCNFMLPYQFISKPIAWLEMISNYQVNAIAAPDFAYKLCVDAISQTQADNLDLSSIEIAINAAEPIRPTTLRDFSKHFQKAGFNHLNFSPGYGLAESTLAISIKKNGSLYTTKIFDRDQLAQDIAKEFPTGRELVSSGEVINGWTAKIVDPKDRTEQSEGVIGEIWVNGSSKALGYWNRPDQSTETFQVRISDSSTNETFLRTGDLGFLYKGQLYICGRLKDLIIVNGENHQPNDLEYSLEQGCLQIGTGCACSCQDIATGELYLFAQVHRHTPKEYLSDICDQIGNVVVHEHQVIFDHIILLVKGQFLLTSSGKIRRKQMLVNFQDGKLKTLYQKHSNQEYQALPSNCDEVYKILHDSLRVLLHKKSIDPNQGFGEMGLSSIVATRWCLQMSQHFNFQVSPVLLFSHSTLSKLCDYIRIRKR